MQASQPVGPKSFYENQLDYQNLSAILKTVQWRTGCPARRVPAGDRRRTADSSGVCLVAGTSYLVSKPEQMSFPPIGCLTEAELIRRMFRQKEHVLTVCTGRWMQTERNPLHSYYLQQQQQKTEQRSLSLNCENQKRLKPLHRHLESYYILRRLTFLKTCSEQLVPWLIDSCRPTMLCSWSVVHFLCSASFYPLVKQQELPTNK